MFICLFGIKINTLKLLQKREKLPIINLDLISMELLFLTNGKKIFSNTFMFRVPNHIKMNAIKVSKKVIIAHHKARHLVNASISDL